MKKANEYMEKADEGMKKARELTALREKYPDVPSKPDSPSPTIIKLRL